jgi:hypothetical protein
MVAARELAPPEGAFVAEPRGQESPPSAPSVCYPALRRLPGRDSHPLDRHSVTPVSRPLPGRGFRRRHDAPWAETSGLIPATQDERGARTKLAALCGPALDLRRE